MPINIDADVVLVYMTAIAEPARVAGRMPHVGTATAEQDIG